MPGFFKSLLFGGSCPPGWAANLGLLVGRASIGLMMAIGHGWGKIYQASESGGHFGLMPGMVEETAKLGFPAPTFFAWCSSLAEFLGGILLALGLLTRPAAAVLAFNMGVAAFMAHADAPVFMTGQGAAKEPALLYFVPAVMFMLIGAGHFSADRMISTLKSKSSGATAA